MRPGRGAFSSPRSSTTTTNSSIRLRLAQKAGIGYSFFRRATTHGHPEVLAHHRKTLLHMPHPQQQDRSLHEQARPGGPKIIGMIGEIVSRDYDNNLYKVRTTDSAHRGRPCGGYAPSAAMPPQAYLQRYEQPRVARHPHSPRHCRGRLRLGVVRALHNDRHPASLTRWYAL